jgi:hypothetical protein
MEKSVDVLGEKLDSFSLMKYCKCCASLIEEVPSRIKDVELQKLENQKIQLDFFSKESIISLSRN